MQMFRLKISHKLFAAFFSILIIAIGAILTARQIFSYNFSKYIQQVEVEKLQNLVPVVEMEYRKGNSWDSLRQDLATWKKRIDIRPEIREILPPPPPEGVPGSSPRRHRIPEIVLLDANRQPIIGDTDGLERGQLLPLMAGGRTVGWLGIAKPQRNEKERPSPWLEQQGRQLYILAAFVILATGLIAFIFSRHLLAPVRRLIEGTRALANRDFSVCIDATASDELGQLAHHFNRMATTLRNYEKLRMQWLGDISHELRTPLAILRGEIEALLDGVRKADQDSLLSLHAEVLRIGKLVDDLHQLTVNDSYQLELCDSQINPVEILMQAMSEYKTRFEQSHIVCAVDSRRIAGKRIAGDGDRLGQVFRNIFENCCRYVKPSGHLEISGEIEGKMLVITFADSGPGVPDESLARLFDRLYRVDVSRSRELGGSGLGLSICRHIIEGHGGTITAHSSGLGGLAIRIGLPRVGC